jgi:hypothetical protein
VCRAGVGVRNTSFAFFYCCCLTRTDDITGWVCACFCRARVLGGSSMISGVLWQYRCWCCCHRRSCRLKDPSTIKTKHTYKLGRQRLPSCWYIIGVMVLVVGTVGVSCLDPLLCDGYVEFPVGLQNVCALRHKQCGQVPRSSSRRNRKLVSGW